MMSPMTPRHARVDGVPDAYPTTATYVVTLFELKCNASNCVVSYTELCRVINTRQPMVTCFSRVAKSHFYMCFILRFVEYNPLFF